jgi:hypothetical protein
VTLFEASAQREYRDCLRLYRNAGHGRRRAAYRRLQLALMMLLLEEQR